MSLIGPPEWLMRFVLVGDQEGRCRKVEYNIQKGGES